MNRLMVALLAAAWLAPAAAHAACPKCKAEQVSTTNAAKDLFGGSDAVGGIGDWYLSNGTVQAIIDDIGTVPTTAGPTVTVDKTSSQAVETGGTLVDLGLNGKNNDQIDQVFNTGGLSLANIFIFHQGDEAQWAAPNIPGAPMPSHNPCVTVGASNTTCPLDVVTDPTNADCAAITVYGVMLGTCKTSSDHLEPCVSGHCGEACNNSKGKCSITTTQTCTTPANCPTTAQTCTTSADCSNDFCSTRTHPTMFVRTTYKVCGKERVIRLSTEVWNKSKTGYAQVLPVFDVFLWGGRGLVPFAPDTALGFSHPALDLSNTGNLLSELTSAPFFAAPGNENPADGPMAHGKNVGTVSYGYYPDPITPSHVDPDGPAASIKSPVTISGLTSLQSPLLTAATIQGLLYGSQKVPYNGSVVFNRKIVVGLKNDVASVMGDVTSNLDSLLLNAGPPVGTVKGSFKPAPSQEGTVTFIRTGPIISGPPTWGSSSPWATLNNGVISEVRAKGSFKVLLPEGAYTLRAVFAGRPDIVPGATNFTVTADATTVITPAITLPKVGKLTVTVVDADSKVGMPAKISLSPSPQMRREFAAFSYALDTGRCSTDLSKTCTTDGGTCGTCFRTCSNVAPQPCGTGSTCPSGFVCASDNYCRKHGCSADAECGPDYVCRADTTDELPESFPGGTAQMQVIYTDHSGKATVEVKPNTSSTPGTCDTPYTVSVSRGLEYTIQKFDNVCITAGATTKLNSGTAVALKRVVDTSGYMSADFHIHSGRSFDASAPLKARVNAFASEGVDVMVATDHDMNTDYMPIIKSLKMTPFMTSIVGTEVTTSVPRPPFMANMWGHINSWPVVYDQTARRNGSVEDEGISANEVYDRLRQQPTMICIGGAHNGMSCGPAGSCGGGNCGTVSCGKGAVCTDVGEHVVQLNHPRAGVSGTVSIGMFNNIGLDPSMDITDCASYPVLCLSSQCAGGTNDGTSCTSNGDCTGGGLCGCISASLPLMADGCNDILNDMNTIPQLHLCTDESCNGYDTSKKGAYKTRNIDFDTMEIDNGGSIGGYHDLRQVRRDWLSILNQGIQVGAYGKRHLLYGTGVSDSHRLVMELAGYSRTYVGVGAVANPASLSVKTFDDTVMSGNMTATTGPFITFTADDGGTPVNMGATLGPSVSSVNLHVKVQAAPWVPVDEVRLIKNGCVMACYNTSTHPAVSDNPSNPYDQTNAEVTRFDETIPDTVTGDSYYIVEASPNLPEPPETPTADPVVNSVAAGAFTYGFSNPIFVDYDGGGYTGITLGSGQGEPSCPGLPSSCSDGAGIASIPSSTMVAQAIVPPPEPSMVGRLWRTLVGPAAADERQIRTPNPEDEERVRRHEREILKPSTERLLWNRIEFPTPAPTPAPGESGD